MTAVLTQIGGQNVAELTQTICVPYSVRPVAILLFLQRIFNLTERLVVIYCSSVVLEIG